MCFAEIFELLFRNILKGVFGAILGYIKVIFSLIILLVSPDRIGGSLKIIGYIILKIV